MLEEEKERNTESLVRRDGSWSPYPWTISDSLWKASWLSPPQTLAASMHTDLVVQHEQIGRAERRSSQLQNTQYQKRTCATARSHFCPVTTLPWLASVRRQENTAEHSVRTYCSTTEQTAKGFSAGCLPGIGSKTEDMILLSALHAHFCCS